MAGDNHQLGQVTLEGIPSRRAYQARVNVEFEVDVDGILHVRLKDDANKDNNAKVTIRAETGRLKEEDVERMMREAVLIGWVHTGRHGSGGCTQAGMDRWRHLVSEVLGLAHDLEVVRGRHPALVEVLSDEADDLHLVGVGHLPQAPQRSCVSGGCSDHA